MTQKTETPKDMQPGVQTRTFWGENLLFSLVELEPYAAVPTHSHPHEQGAYLLAGRLELTIGAQTRWLSPGQLFLVPGWVEHSLRAGAEPVRLVAAFTPVREDLKY